MGSRTCAIAFFPIILYLYAKRWVIKESETRSRLSRKYINAFTLDASLDHTWVCVWQDLLPNQMLAGYRSEIDSPLARVYAALSCHYTSNRYQIAENRTTNVIHTKFNNKTVLFSCKPVTLMHATDMWMSMDSSNVKFARERRSVSVALTRK